MQQVELISMFGNRFSKNLGFHLEIFVVSHVVLVLHERERYITFSNHHRYFHLYKYSSIGIIDQNATQKNSKNNVTAKQVSHDLSIMLEQLFDIFQLYQYTITNRNRFQMTMFSIDKLC